MKIYLFISAILITFSSLFISCDDEDSSGEETDVTNTVSTESISGLLNSKNFTPKTIHFEKGQSFGENGYDFKLYSDVVICDEFQSIGDITFFIESENILNPGSYDAKGPYFSFKDESGSGTSSFFGATVIIETVTENEISGRVKGGDKGDGVNYIEGSFVASLCQK